MRPIVFAPRLRKFVWREAGLDVILRAVLGAMLGAVLMCLPLTAQQATAAEPAFDVATIRPSAERVQFERNGRTEVNHGRLVMRDVSVSTCLQWAYGFSEGQVIGPPALRSVRYDLSAKTEEAATEAEMRRMLQALLRERFHLEFHHEAREMKVYTLLVAKGGVKMKPARADEAFFRENSATGTVARAMSIKELADYLSDPLNAPLTDATGLPGRWDFTIDFTPYVELQRQQGDVKPDVAAVLGMALKGDLGLEMVRGRRVVDVAVVDRLEAPTEN